MRDGPIITDCEDFDLAIESFKVDLKTLPVIIPTIKYNELMKIQERLFIKEL